MLTLLRPLLATLRPLLALLLLPILVGCPDNSGGPPPAGTELEEFSRAASPAGGIFCDLFRDDAFLWHDAAEVQAFLDRDCTNADPTAADELLATAGALATGEALVGVSVELGGCRGEFGVVGFYLDDVTVTAWVLRGDTSYGRPNTACTTDLGGAFEVWRVTGAAAGSEAAILVGTFNPESPGAPALPGAVQG